MLDIVYSALSGALFMVIILFAYLVFVPGESYSEYNGRYYLEESF